jgi:hypothetical protein
MTFGKRPSQSRRSNYSGGGIPAWLVFLVGVALVFALYYLWVGLRDFVATGGLGIQEATEQAIDISTATAERIQSELVVITPLPTLTPLPECQDFVVISEMRANLRSAPNTSAQVIGSLIPGETLCVIEHDSSGDWYLVDLNPATRRVEPAYIAASIVEAVNPTPTPTNTFTPAPTVTPVPTETPTITPSPAPTNTPDPDATDTPTPTPLPTPTTPVQHA